MNKKSNIVNLPVKTKIDTDVLKEGSLGKLTYKLFNRGNIQITDGYNIFRKDCTVFLSELLKNTYILDEGQTIEISGAGDTNSFVITKKGNDVTFHIGRTLPNAIERLISILEER